MSVLTILGLSEKEEIWETMISSAKASISVILVLLYGFMARKKKLVGKEGESDIARISTNFFLPCLLFSEIGPLSTADNVKTYWPIVVFSLIFQIFAFGVAELSHLAGMPQVFVPMLIFNNVTSLPLLLLQALSKSGSLDELITQGDDLNAVLRKGRVYILINALVGNLTRFALGPYLMKTHDLHFLKGSSSSHGAIALPDDEEDEMETQDHHQQQSDHNSLVANAKVVGIWLKEALNPPLIGGLFAIFCGLIPFFHTQLFNAEGWLTPLGDSLENVGALYTALQMFILGAQLYSKKSTKTSPWILVWLFTYRFFLAPAISIGTIYGIRTRWPGLLVNEPVFDLVLMISNIGPPALTLSAIADMVHLGDEIEGQVARTLTIAYIVTPLIAFPLTAALAAVKASGVGQV